MLSHSFLYRVLLSRKIPSFFCSLETYILVRHTDVKSSFLPLFHPDLSTVLCCCAEQRVEKSIVHPCLQTTHFKNALLIRYNIFIFWTISILVCTSFFLQRIMSPWKDGFPVSCAIRMLGTRCMRRSGHTVVSWWIVRLSWVLYRTKKFIYPKLHLLCDLSFLNKGGCWRSWQSYINEKRKITREKKPWWIFHTPSYLEKWGKPKNTILYHLK